MPDTVVTAVSPIKTVGQIVRRGGAVVMIAALAWWILFDSPTLIAATFTYFNAAADTVASVARGAAAVKAFWMPYEHVAFWGGCGALVVGMLLDPLGFSTDVDTANEKVGVVCNWLILLACIVSGGNAMVRYAYDSSSNAWLEVQWYMFAVIIMFGASYTLKRNEHVRVDLFYMTLSRRGQLWVDILGTIVFLLPTCAILAWLSWPFFLQSYNVLENSSNAGGLLRWPIKLVLPLGFGMVALQGLSELIKRVAFLNDYAVDSLEAHYERPTQ